jgi:hypothetical protein
VWCPAAAAAAAAADKEVYRLPEHMREAVEEQYRRDVARVHGEEMPRFDDEYKSFMQVTGSRLVFFRSCEKTAQYHRAVNYVC